jgi:hypothetical protein
MPDPHGRAKCPPEARGMDGPADLANTADLAAPGCLDPHRGKLVPVGRESEPVNDARIRRATEATGGHRRERANRLRYRTGLCGVADGDLRREREARVILPDEINPLHHQAINPVGAAAQAAAPGACRDSASACGQRGTSQRYSSQQRQRRPQCELPSGGHRLCLSPGFGGAARPPSGCWTADAPALSCAAGR